MTLDQTLDALRELGVSVPLDLSEAQLLNQAKALCPWTMTIEQEDDHYIAYTRKAFAESTAEAETAAHAGMRLVLKQLEGKRYSAFDTRYKTAARGAWQILNYMNFSTANAAAPQETGSRYLAVGINDGVMVTDILPGQSTKKGTPFLGVTVVKGESTQEIPFYMSDGAAPYSLRNIRHILVDGLGVDGDALDAISADTLEDYAKKLTAMIPKDKTFRLKFTGEQYHKTDGSGIGTRRVIGYPPFAEPTGSNTLKFNEAKEVKAAPMPDAGAPGAVASGDNDLPF